MRMWVMTRQVLKLINMRMYADVYTGANYYAETSNIVWFGGHERGHGNNRCMANAREWSRMWRRSNSATEMGFPESSFVSIR